MTALLHRTTPLAAVARGMLAGAAGTAAMTGWQALAARLQAPQSGTGRDDDAEGDQSVWERAPTPAPVARRIAEGLFDVHPPAKLIPALTHAMHWTYGIGWGGLYGLLRDPARSRGLREGAAFGVAVWSVSYAQLVPMGLYQPPWRYPPKDVALDLSYHLVYGAGVAGGYRLLEP
jgi:hypothetical protein